MTDEGGWMRVVQIDARRKGCPTGFHKITSPVHVCTRIPSATSGCISAKFGTRGITYSEVRGYAYGHQVRKLFDLNNLILSI